MINLLNNYNIYDIYLAVFVEHFQNNLFLAAEWLTLNWDKNAVYMLLQLISFIVLIKNV